MESIREILKRIRQIELRTSRLVNRDLAGQYHSVFKGSGMNFEEVREYAAGDEIRSIDWNVTARLGDPYVKKFKEERELAVMLVVDLSASGEFGSVSSSKRELAAEVAAVIALSGVRNGDRVGLLLFTEGVELYIPPKKGRAHVLRIIREVLYFQPVGRQTSIRTALEYLNRLLHRRAVVFLLSDFVDSDFDKALAVAARRHDLVAMVVRDPVERKLPAIGRMLLQDAETGEQVEIDTRSAAARKAYAGLAARRDKELLSLLKRNRVDAIELSTETDYVPALRQFFHRRERRQVSA